MQVGSAANVVALTTDLVRIPSVSRDSNLEVAGFIFDHLTEMGFEIERIKYVDPSGIDKVNLIARRGPGVGGLAYFAHNDVVPADDWDSDPFAPTIKEGRLYGRGTCDMKGSLASMLCAIARIDPAQQRCPIWVVVTADEEVGFQGAKCVVANSAMYKSMISEQPMAIIGEPTRLQVVHAHKGITGFSITSTGKAAHSSTRDGVNATLPIIPVLSELYRLYERSESEASLMDSRFDPPTLSWNIGVRGGDSAVNVTPPHCQAWVTLRPMPLVDGRELIDQALDNAKQMGLKVKEFEGSGPLWVDPECPLVRQMLELTGTTEPMTVCYGTDGGVFTQMNQVVVCGPGDIAQAHTVNEWVDLKQLDLGVDLYARAIQRWCCQGD